MKFAIIRERKNPPDRRVVFSPEKLKDVSAAFAKAEFIVESSPIRVFNDAEYASQGFTVTDDVTDADVMLGVKEVPIENLIAGKKYFYFSHTIKKQPYNRKLLQAMLDKKIEMYDHEVITKASGGRLIGFGRYAGIVGAYNGFLAWGKRFDSWNIEKAENLKTQIDLNNQLDIIKDKLPAIKIVVTGSGKVGGGILEIIKQLGIREVSVDAFLNQQFTEAVYTHVDVMDYNKRSDGEAGDKYAFYADPSGYESDFMRFAQVADMFIAGHFYGDGAPYLFTREDAKHPSFKIKLVADVSCDIDGPVASTIKPSTIADPIYGYNPHTEAEDNYKNEGVITVMAVDNLPCELPLDASQGFGEMFAQYVIPAFYNDDADGILDRARMTTHEGTLTDRYSYLQDYVDGKE